MSSTRRRKKKNFFLKDKNEKEERERGKNKSDIRISAGERHYSKSGINREYIMKKRTHSEIRNNNNKDLNKN